MGKRELLTVGWREWVNLPDLGVHGIKAKIDTGARTSSLHALDIEPFNKSGVEFVRFSVLPQQKNSQCTIECTAKVHEYRLVKSSTGHQTERPVIITHLEILGNVWEVEITLANREAMGFRMLLGREAYRNRLLVDAGKSYYGKKASGNKNKYQINPTTGV